MTKRDPVDEALNYQHASDDRDGSRAWQAIDALAAEVRRLRAEVDGHNHWALAMVDKCDALTVRLAKAEENAARNIEALRAKLAYVEALTRNVDAVYELLDDNSNDHNRGKMRLFLALDDVREALRD